MIIAVDGPSASGKGTLSKKLAEHFSLVHLDTGSIYRALAFKVLETGIDYTDVDAVCRLAKSLKEEDFKIKGLNAEKVGAMASKVAVIPEIRDIFLDFQRKVAYNERGAVLDGRDIGTVICPDADYKFYIVADVETRSKRRHADLIALGKDVSYEEVLKMLSDRDSRDMERKNAPLKKAEDAFQIDSTHINSDEVFKLAVKFIEEKRKK